MAFQVEIERGVRIECQIVDFQDFVVPNNDNNVYGVSHGLVASKICKYRYELDAVCVCANGSSTIVKIPRVHSIALQNPNSIPIAFRNFFLNRDNVLVGSKFRSLQEELEKLNIQVGCEFSEPNFKIPSSGVSSSESLVDKLLFKAYIYRKLYLQEMAQRAEAQRVGDQRAGGGQRAGR